MADQPPFLEDPHRVVLFGGQGSPTILSAGTASKSAKAVKNSAAAATLLSRCHVAFLDELAMLMLTVQSCSGPQAWRYPSTTVLLHQLLHYLAEFEHSGAGFSASFDHVLEASGFCAGLLPAAVVASSRDCHEFVKNAVEAFRLAFWIGCRASIGSLVLCRNRSVQTPLSLAVSGLSLAELEKKLRELDAPLRSLFSAVSISILPSKM